MDYLYINILHLLNTAISTKVLFEVDGKILVFRTTNNEDGGNWFLEDKVIIAKELMEDIEGQDIIKRSLEEKGVIFELL